MTASHPSLVLFDLDGVLVAYDRPGRIAHLGAALGREPERVQAALFGSTQLEDRYDSGVLSTDEYLSELGDALEAKTHALCDGFEAAAHEAGVAFTTNRVGGMFGLFFSSERVDTYAQAIACDTAAFNRFFHAMLERGVYLAPSAFEAGFVSSAHDDAVIAATIDAARASFQAL